MKKNIKILYIIGIIFMTYSCNYTPYDASAGRIRSCKKSILNIYEKKNIFEHFPESTDTPSLFRGVKMLPTSNDIFGYLYQYSTFEKDNKNIEIIRKDSFVYKTQYKSSDNIVFNSYGFRDNDNLSFNHWYKDKYPMPSFEDMNFSLGMVFEEVLKSNGKIDKESQYVIPLDLEVIVLDAKPGYYWKIKSDNKRPDSLKEWQHGYSRGYAISEKYKKIVYWTIVW